MEHDQRFECFGPSTGLVLTKSQAERLDSFAQSIATVSRLFNLTGHSAYRQIVDDLIVASINPLKDMNVPRGTVFCDIGTGGGVPGVPVAVYRPDLRAFLVDSSKKKIDFVSDFCSANGLGNVTAIQARAEELGRITEYRESFDFVLSRAMAEPYIVIEMGAPLVKIGGFVYIYSNLDIQSIGIGILAHAAETGLEPASERDREERGIVKEGLLFIKKRMTGDKYPRRYAAIRREADRQCANHQY